ncbi:MAG: hydantoinase/oxoprolinase family protein, partial [Mariprofundus sp.]|nr:hydantoinase/oxoprolinase family protein [Mariprofundus sp.]
MFLGVDTGGTFTDFVLFDGQKLRFHKVLSTSDDPSRAIEQGIRDLGLDASALHLVHGSTVATNAILEHKGARTLFVANNGLEDVLIIGRQTRGELYDLIPEPKAPWISHEDCMGVPCRLSADGQELVHLDSNAGHLLNQKIEQGGYDAVAVCLLFSFLNPVHEQLLAKETRQDVFISLSHQVLPEYREYERGATTFLNAYVGPLVQRYLRRLESKLVPKHLFVMHSAGGVMNADVAGKQAVRLILSGPAGGLVAAQEIGRQTGVKKLITLDMGGTSTDVALLDGAPAMTTEGSVAGIPVALAMLDIHTIGAGGGSLCWIDAAGLPQVGPESAGAQPGPACYGLGGCLPTVTDANLVIGRIPATAKLGGSMSLDVAAARQTFEKFGGKIGLTSIQAAEAVVRIAEEHMAGALRVVSVERGVNPAEFSLLCFGGAGGLHACALAEKLGMDKVIFPVASGAFSALGMLAGRQQGQFSRTRRLLLGDDATVNTLSALFAELEREAATSMQGLALTFERRVDIRYAGQGFHITIDMYDDDEENMQQKLQQRFEHAHSQAYGHILQRPIEIMTARLTAVVEQK